MNSPVTLQTLADRLGLSRATVSRALHNHPRLSRATVAKVQSLAKELGYQTDPEINRLMVHLRQRRKLADRPTVALIINQQIPFDLTGPESGQSVLVGAVERTRECGYQPEVFNIYEFEKQGLQIDKVLYSRGISGLIICPFEVPGPLPELKFDHFSMVAIGHSIRTAHLHRVVTNQYQGMRDCVRRLVNSGYQRIGAILEVRSDKRTNGFYRSAYLLERENHGEDRLLPILIYDAFARDRWLPEFAQWCKRHQPDAIIGSEEYLQALQPWLNAQKRAIPDDFGMVSLHLNPANPCYTGILQNSLLVGRAAANALVGQMQNYETGIPKAAHTILVEGEWHEGHTARPV